MYELQVLTPLYRLIQFRVIHLFTKYASRLHNSCRIRQKFSLITLESLLSEVYMNPICLIIYFKLHIQGISATEQDVYYLFSDLKLKEICQPRKQFTNICIAFILIYSSIEQSTFYYIFYIVCIS